MINTTECLKSNPFVSFNLVLYTASLRPALYKTVG